MSDLYNIKNIWSDWETVRYIGAGSFGKVYEIVRNKFGFEEHCALKVVTIPSDKMEIQSLRNDGMDEVSVTEYYRELVSDFVQEIALMSKLKGHPNIVGYEDYVVNAHEDEVGWDIIIRMELLTDFSSYASAHPMSEADIARMGIQLCDALEMCEKHNIIHRDIKPDNIFVSKSGRFKLGDFGVARTIEKAVSALSKKGTYTYMAPEVYKGEDYGMTVDLYSLGIVMYKMLNNNREPFMPPYPQQIKYNDKNTALVCRMNGQVIPPLANVSDALNRIVLKACAFESKDRYQSAAQMKADLINCLSSLDTAVNNPADTTEVMHQTVSQDDIYNDRTVSVQNGPVPPVAPVQPVAAEPSAQIPPVVSYTQQPPTQQPVAPAPYSQASYPAAQPTPPKKKGNLKWLFILIAVLCVAAVALTAVYIITENDVFSCDSSSSSRKDDDDDEDEDKDKDEEETTAPAETLPPASGELTEDFLTDGYWNSYEDTWVWVSFYADGTYNRYYDHVNDEFLKDNFDYYISGDFIYSSTGDYYYYYDSVTDELTEYDAATDEATGYTFYKQDSSTSDIETDTDTDLSYDVITADELADGYWETQDGGAAVYFYQYLEEYYRYDRDTYDSEQADFYMDGNYIYSDTGSYYYHYNYIMDSLVEYDSFTEEQTGNYFYHQEDYY